VNVKKLVEFGEGDLKLIKTSSIAIIFILLMSGQGFASDPDGIKLNNEAVELLDEAIKERAKAQKEKAKQQQKSNPNGSGLDINVSESIEELKNKSTLAKLWSLVFGITKKEKEPAKTEESGEKTDEAKIKPGEFLPGEEKKEEGEGEATSIDEDLVFDAHKRIISATMKSGELPEIRMNLGLSFELSGEAENSYKAYNMAELAAAGNPSLEFIARYNKARVLAAQKKIPLALAAYQSALELNPESLEVKTNIELLMQQQQGGGKGGEDDKKDKEGEDGKDPKPDGPIKKNPKNSEYKSQNLSEKDMQKILEELKNQEQNIREKEYNKGVKEKSRDKDW